MRVVIDTNVWISGLLWHGPAWQILRLAESDTLTLCMTLSMLDELKAVSHYPKLQSRLHQLDFQVADLMGYVLRLAKLFEDPEGPILVRADPDDDLFLRCAEFVGARYIISGDHHLLDLKQHAGIPVLTPREFLTQVFPDVT